MKYIFIIFIFVFILNINVYAESTSIYSSAAGHRIGTVNTDDVYTIFEYGGWILVDTPYGRGWIHYSLPSAVSSPDMSAVFGLHYVMSRFTQGHAIYFYNIESGWSFNINGHRDFFSASIAKAAFSLFIFQEAEAGRVDLNERLMYIEEDRWPGSGIIRTTRAPGAMFTRRELLGLNISQSDNIATRILARYHGINGARAFMASLDIRPEFIGDNVFNGSITAIQTGRLAKEIYRFANSGSIYGLMLWYDLLNNDFPFIISSYETASKTGWARRTAWHDMAIINAESPFILVILSERIGWTEYDFADFAYITNIFEEFNRQWFHVNDGLDLSIFYNGEALKINTNEKLPLRQLFESMGYLVHWEASTNSVHLLNHSINLNTGEVFNQWQQFLGRVQITNRSGTIYVPIHFLDKINISYSFDLDLMILLIYTNIKQDEFIA